MRRPPFHAKGCALVPTPPRGPIAIQTCTRCGSAITTGMGMTRYHPTRNACPEPKEPDDED